MRQSSFTRHVIGPDEHRRWWTGVIADPARVVLVYEHGGVACGVVTFSGSCWGFYLDIEGLGDDVLAAWISLEREAIAYAFGPLGLTVLRGEVLAWNSAVRSLHRRNGFVETTSDERVIDGVVEQVVTVELTR